ncbi:MAG: GNAT family N-acetyltransferase [Muribaculaceae bacterium]|nr:GNAT family N-acetyltransferase [Muribaculaceae bacterium]
MILLPYECCDGVHEQIERIYMESFPESERRPAGEWWRMICGGEFPLQLMVICDDEGKETVGFISFWRFSGFVYVEHFAVDARFRCGGTGSRALGEFLKRIDMPVVLEVERRGANDMADRRIGFYSRMGFHTVDDFDYVQPPYAPGLPSVPLLLMSTRPEAVAPDVVAATLFREVYGVR